MHHEVSVFIVASLILKQSTSDGYVTLKVLSNWIFWILFLFSILLHHFPLYNAVLIRDFVLKIMFSFLGMYSGITMLAWSILTVSEALPSPPHLVVGPIRSCPFRRPRLRIQAITLAHPPTPYQPPFKSLCQVRTRQHFFTSFNNLYHKIRIVFSIFFDRD